MKPHKGQAEFQILSGWKEIASYLGLGVRTVQRYEREGRLPVHRLGGKGRVTAFKSELDRWVKGVPVQLDDRTTHHLHTQSNRVAAQFLQLDAEVGLTFSGLALKAHDSEKRERQSDVARRAYDTVSLLRRKFDLSEAEKNKLDASLDLLKSELRQLGKKL